MSTTPAIPKPVQSRFTQHCNQLYTWDPDRFEDQCIDGVMPVNVLREQIAILRSKLKSHGDAFWVEVSDGTVIALPDMWQTSRPAAAALVDVIDSVVGGGDELKIRVDEQALADFVEGATSIHCRHCIEMTKQALGDKAPQPVVVELADATDSAKEMAEVDIGKLREYLEGTKRKAREALNASIDVCNAIDAMLGEDGCARPAKLRRTDSGASSA